MANGMAVEALPFPDRSAAGRYLASGLEHYRRRPDGLVLALVCGGVPVGAEVARCLELPLDVLSVRSLSVPGRSELAMGAVASGGTRILNDDVLASLGVPAPLVESVSQRARAQLEAMESGYRGSRPVVDVAGRTVIVVDDGLTTWSVLRAAVSTLRQRRPSRIVAALPAVTESVGADLAKICDEVVCASPPGHVSIPSHRLYARFQPVLDKDIRALLAAAPLPA